MSERHGSGSFSSLGLRLRNNSTIAGAQTERRALALAGEAFAWRLCLTGLSSGV